MSWLGGWQWAAWEGELAAMASMEASIERLLESHSIAALDLKYAGGPGEYCLLLVAAQCFVWQGGGDLYGRVAVVGVAAAQ